MEVEAIRIGPLDESFLSHHRCGIIANVDFQRVFRHIVHKLFLILEHRHEVPLEELHGQLVDSLTQWHVIVLIDRNCIVVAFAFILGLCGFGLLPRFGVCKGEPHH